MKNVIKIIAKNGNTGFNKTFFSPNASLSVEEVESLMEEGGEETDIFSILLETDEWGMVELMETDMHGKVVTLRHL